MSALEQLEMRVAGQGRQLALLADEVRRLRRLGAGDVLVLEEWARIKGLTLAEAMGPHRNRAIAALRDSLSAARVGKVFGLTGRQVRRVCGEGAGKG